ncbi:putative glycerophosphoryl diester phosphodiesterase 1 [Acorus calamus]|uniref:glycerophosphodiester phosphodiesterase n=1 Tax=Acorus calamus TaxID=4465 RepID=A0AAV9D688_ACOCL|nr:putative glycerophosphoryl diester phosphodiesterase 1 [Acorus calamus]
MNYFSFAGNAPIVIAKGGFSGLFPDSSFNSYQLALNTSLPNTVLWCDVHLTKDGIGICLSNILLDNSTDIAFVHPKVKKTYLVNGVAMEGWFSKDFTLNDLGNVSLIQGIYSRTDKFDGAYIIRTVRNVTQLKPPGIWLNIQYDVFYSQQNLSMRSFLLSTSRTSIINYVSSPEVGFLRSVAKRFNRTKTKLIFRFLESNAIEPSTKLSYASLLKNLTFIKTFASGILVPKYYIWPVNPNLYVDPHTSVVTDAHKAGLEIYASEFANDARFAYNYSYDPIAEYLSFIDNTEFSVDGVLSEFPITPSAAIGCFSHINKNNSGQAKPLVISNNGASGVYPGCTDLSYIQAVEDGADIIDCNVQVTSDNVPICLTSIDLSDGTTAVEVPPFRSRMSIVPQIKNQPGIFSFNFMWEEIKNLTPRISNPFVKFMLRNPAYKNAGNFWSLSEFLNYAKAQPLVGVLLNIENAVYLSTQQGIGIVDIVLDILNTAGFNNMTDPQVFIQSKDSAVLARLKQQTMYKLMYMVDETISDVTDTAIQDIKSFAHSVVINKKSIYSTNMAFITSKTNVVQKLQSANLSVYTYLFQNEFQAQAWDFFSDPTVELNTFVQAARIDGVITDFPGTATAYKKNTCLKLKKTPKYMKPVQVGSLLGFIRPNFQPPAQAPSPVLTEADVSGEPPLPPVSVSPVPPPPRNGQAHREIPILLSLALMIGFLFI